MHISAILSMYACNCNNSKYAKNCRFVQMMQPWIPSSDAAYTCTETQWNSNIASLWLREKFWRKNWEQGYTECSFKNCRGNTSSANALSSTRLVDQHIEDTTLVFWKMDFWSMCCFLPGFLMLVFTQQMSSHLRKPHFFRHCIGIKKEENRNTQGKVGF